MARVLMILVCVLALPAVALGANGTESRSGDGYFPSDYREIETDPQAGEDIRKYAPVDSPGPHGNFGAQPVHDNQRFATFRADRFEHQWRDDNEEILLWDVSAWVGNDFNKLSAESEGEFSLDEDEVEEAGAELFYTRTLSTFWDVQAGLRHDFEPDPSRSFFALGLQGLAPLWLEMDLKAYVSEDGDVSAAVEAEYELFITQRLQLSPRLEAGFSAQDVPEYETWQGMTDLILGARLLYQIRRKFTPYIGVTWSRKIGETGHNVDKEGGDVESAALVAGLRFWF
ncbi:MAG: copper resistance protein B [Desulfohalobiaceae bacterium]